MSIYSEPAWDDVRPSFDEFSFCSNFACCGLRLDMHSLITHFEDAHVLIIDSHGHCVRPCSSWDERTDPLVLAHTLSKISAPSPVTTLLSTPASKGLTRLVVEYPHAGPMRRRPTTAISGALDDLFIKPPPQPVLTNRVVPNAPAAAAAPYLLSPPLSEDEEETTAWEMSHGDDTTPTSWSPPRPLLARSPSPSILASSQATSSLQSPASGFETDSANTPFSPPCTPTSASPAMLSSSFSSPLTPASSVLPCSPSSSSSSVSYYSPKHTNSRAYIHPSSSIPPPFNRYPAHSTKRHLLLPLPKEKLHKPKPRRKDRSSANRRNTHSGAHGSGSGGGGRSRRSNAREKRFRCPRTGCTKSYLNPNGLKYHLEKGTCVMEEEDVEPVFAPLPLPVERAAEAGIRREASLGVDDELLALVSSPAAERRRRGDGYGYDDEKEESADDEGEEDEEMLPSSLSSPSLSPASSSSPLPVYFY